MMNEATAKVDEYPTPFAYMHEKGICEALELTDKKFGLDMARLVFKLGKYMMFKLVIEVKLDTETVIIGTMFGEHGALHDGTHDTFGFEYDEW